jgi:hypothetical protein
VCVEREREQQKRGRSKVILERDRLPKKDNGINMECWAPMKRRGGVNREGEERREERARAKE